MIQLITDTSANLPEELLSDYQIGVIPFSYTVNGKSPEPFEGKRFYRAMREGADVKTGMINPQTYRDTFQPLLEAGKDVLYIGMSGGISGSASAAESTVRELKKQYPERKIKAVDSMAASLGEGLQVLHAAKDIRAGMEYDLILDRAKSRSHRIGQYFTVEDLRYLYKGGRITKVAAAVGTLLQIKPILKGDPEGRIVLHGRSHGMKGALMSLTKIYQTLGENSPEIGIAHADAPENADLLEAMLRDTGFEGTILKVCYEPVTGSHVGPGAVALFFRK